MTPLTPCVETTHALDKDGYGHCKVIRFGVQINLVHRLAWIDANGRLPAPGMNILHRCDNPPCINAEHLYEGTQAQNIQDTVDRGRHHQAGQTECKRGHELTAENTRVTRDGKRVCRQCMAENQRAWRRRNAEHLRQYQREWRARRSRNRQDETGDSADLRGVVSTRRLVGAGHAHLPAEEGSRSR